MPTRKKVDKDHYERLSVQIKNYLQKKWLALSGAEYR